MACPLACVNKGQLARRIGEPFAVRVPHRFPRGSAHVARAGAKEVARRIASKKDELGADDAYEVVKMTLETVVELVAEGEKVTLPGFGTFTPTTQKARMSRNPRTGEKFSTDAKVVPKFSMSKAFKKAVSENLKPEEH